jgi:hypothetical protein
VNRYGLVIAGCLVAGVALYLMALAGVGEFSNPVADGAGLASVAFLAAGVVVSALALVRSIRRR